MSIAFSPNLGRYWDTDTGRMVPRSQVIALRDGEVESVGTRLRELAEAATRKEISADTFSRLARETLKPALTRQATLGAGGVSQMSDRQLGTLGTQARLAYGSLRKLTLQARRGEITPAQFAARAEQLAGNVTQAFNRAEQLNRAENGFAEGWRTVESAHPCPDCPGYETGGWVPIGEIVPPGYACRCGGNCKCKVKYRQGGGDVSKLAETVMYRQTTALPSDVPMV